MNSVNVPLAHDHYIESSCPPGLGEDDIDGHKAHVFEPQAQPCSFERATAKTAEETSVRLPDDEVSGRGDDVDGSSIAGQIQPVA
jgi:hypothetical protein